MGPGAIGVGLGLWKEGQGLGVGILVRNSCGLEPPLSLDLK